MKLEGRKANFLGDSITFGRRIENPEDIYWNVLKRECGLAEARGYGIRGTTIAVQLALDEPHWSQNFISRVDEMDEDADLIVVFGGTNDFGHGDSILGQMGDHSPYTFHGACYTLMKKLLIKYPTADIVFLTPLQREIEERGGRRLSDFVKAIKEEAEYFGFPVVDLYATSGIQPQIKAIRELYCPDGLHPNEAGHRRIYSRLRGVLETL